VVGGNQGATKIDATGQASEQDGGARPIRTQGDQQQQHVEREGERGTGLRYAEPERGDETSHVGARWSLRGEDGGGTGSYRVWTGKLKFSDIREAFCGPRPLREKRKDRASKP